MTAADEGVRLEGLIEWHEERISGLEDCLSQVASTVEGDVSQLRDGLAFHTQAAALLTAMGEERDRLREALEKIEKAPAWGAPERWEPTPFEVRQLARAALTPQTEAQSHAALNHQTGEG